MASDTTDAAYLAAIVRSASDAIIGKALDGTIISWNAGAERMFGYSAAEAIGRSIAILFPADRVDEEQRVVAEIEQGHRTQPYETIRRTKDGRHIPVSLTVSPILGADGAVIGASRIVRDISDQQRDRVALARSNRRAEEVIALLDALLKGAPLGFAFVDREYRYVRVNQALADMTNRPMEAYVGRPVADAVPEIWAQIEPAYRNAVEHGIGTSNQEVSGLRRGGAGEMAYFLASHYPVRVNDEIIGVGIIVVDITERRAMEAQLRQAHKMEAVGNLSGGMAHDFNNILGVIIGILDFVRPLLSDNDEARELVDRALDASLHGTDLTRSLLAFARRQPLLLRKVEVNALVTDTFRLLSRMLGEDIAVSLELAEDVWPVNTDDAQLGACLANLAANARDAMRKGGRLTVRTENRVLDAGYVETHAEVSPGAYAMIEVTDTGTGMTAETVDHIFEPFYTTKEQGTGLGLSMVFGFVKQSGGHIAVYSEPGVGTTFRIYLPRLVAEGAVAVAPVPAALPRSLSGGETVLAVDDNDDILFILQRQLNELGYRALTASSPAEAQRLLAREKVDLLLTDVVMPGGVNGLELAEAARSRLPHMKIVLTSGFPDAQFTQAKLSSLSAVRLLSKPYRRDELARALREAFEA